MSKEERGKKAPGVLLYDAWFLAFAYLSDEDAGRVLKSIGDHIQGFDVDLPDRLRKTTEHMFDQIDIDRAKYVSACEQNSTNRKRPLTTVERPLTTVERPLTTVERPLTNSNSNNNSNTPNGVLKENTKEKTGKPSRVFVPPTLEEVEEEIRIKGYNVDALEFFNYYDSQGWKKANGQKVTSWKGCLVTWIKKDESRNKAGSLPTQPETEPFNDWLQRRLREEEEKKNGNINIPQVVGYIPTGLPEAGQ